MKTRKFPEAAAADLHRIALPEAPTDGALSGGRVRCVKRFAVLLLVFACGAAEAVSNDCHDAYWNWHNVAALKRCQVAADSGDPEAQFGYGLILWSGPPKTINRREALDWLRKSARQGHWLAQVTLGTLLQQRELGASLRNRPEAVAWLTRAGEAAGAARLRANLSDADKRAADSLASEFLAKYPSNRPPAGAHH